MIYLIIVNNEDLIKKAKEVAIIKKLTNEAVSGEVGAVILDKNGNIYTDVSLSAASGIGACAEYSAVMEMLKKGASQIQKIVAVCNDGKILPPCGRCRELFFEIDRNNLQTQILLSNRKVVTLKELLNYRWQEAWDNKDK